LIDPRSDFFGFLFYLLDFLNLFFGTKNWVIKDESNKELTIPLHQTF
jgi:hypothetical protein